jgi:dTMP kinase
MDTSALTSKQFYGKGLPHVNPSLLRGRLIVIEGADGSGRSTQINMLREWLERLGHATVDVGLKRSSLVGPELEKAKQGNILSPITQSLFYATDFADQLENKVIPALRSGFIVLSDRYIYTLMARDIVRGASPEWIRKVYGFALIPDVVFYLAVSPRVLAERNFQKRPVLDYWESGMDIRRSGDMFECFIRYQTQVQRVFRSMQAMYGFERINGNRSVRAIARELQARVEFMLHGESTVAIEEPVE